MTKGYKTEVKVQKETPSVTVKFQPKKLHLRKSINNNQSGYLSSIKRMFETKLFAKHQSPSKQKSSTDLSQQKRSSSAKKSRISTSKQKSSIQTTKSASNDEEYTRRNTQSALLSSHNNKITETPEPQSPQLISPEDIETTLHKNYLKIKYIKKMSGDSALIGNENQLDFVVFRIQNHLPVQEKKWQIYLQKPIEGVTTSHLAESKILFWADYELYIHETNQKNMAQKPHFIHKITASQKILSVQFIKRNIFIICCRSHVQIYEITQVSKDLTINKLETKQFNCPKHYEVVEVPELFDNNIKIFYADMNEEEDTNENQNDKRSESGAMFGGKKGKKKDVFSLHFVEVQYDYCNSKVFEMKKVYDIKKNLRNQIKLLNVSTNIFFLSLKTQVLAVKNGLIIDSVGVNFKFDNCYLKIIKKDLLVHILTDKIEFYHLRLNYDCLPQKIIVEPFDSIYFPRKTQDEFLSLIPINQGYAILFQADFQSQTLEQLKKGHINYWYGLTYPIPLQQKLNQIFPSKNQLDDISFEALQTLCDMAGKMGLSENEAYRQLWRKCKKQSQKDYQILLASKDYKIIQQEITTLLKKKAQKFRLIIKNQQICLDFLRSRIFENSCTLQNLEEFSYCHFFNIKLNCYKDIQVERRRFQLQIYNKGVSLNRKIIQMITGSPQKTKKSPLDDLQQIQSPIIISSDPNEIFNQEDSEILSEGEIQDGDEQQLIEASQQLQSQLKAKEQTNPQNLFATFLKTSRRYSDVLEDKKTVEVREREKLIYEVENKMKQPQPNQIKINIKDYYFFRDCNLKQLFLETVADLMSKQHTFNDHLKYYNLRALVNNFKLSFRGIYQDILIQLISTYKHKVTRLLQHYMQLIPYEFIKIPQDMTDPDLCQGIWNPIQNRQLEDCLFLSDITTIENREVVEKFSDTLWFKRNNLTHHGVITATRQEIKQKYSEENMVNIRDHYFYLFISKFLQIKCSLNKEIKQVQQTFKPVTPKSFASFFVDTAKQQQKQQQQKRQQQAKEKVVKQLRKTNQLLKRIQQVYPLIPVHLKGFIHLYFDLYNFLEQIQFENKPYSSMYEFLKLRDFELFKIFFNIEKKIKGFIIKQILVKYENSELVEEGREKFIQGIQHYFDSELSEITDLKTILNRLNGQTREFHIQFEGLYDCLLSAIMKKIRISPKSQVKLDELLIYVQNIPFSTANGNIFQKLILIQQVHLQIQTLRRSGIDMSILQIKNNPQLVISALVQAELKAQLLVLNCPILRHSTSVNLDGDKPSSLEVIDLGKSNQINLVKAIMLKVLEDKEMEIESVDQLKMYFYKCISELLCIKRHFYGQSYQHLLGFIFVTELMEKPKLVPFIQQALQDPQIKELLSISHQQDELKFTKALVYYSYRRRLSRYPYSYLDSQDYLRGILRLLSKTDHQRLLIEQQIKYCHIFRKCDYKMPYPLSFNKQLPIMDEIEFHIRQIPSQKIDQLDVAKLFKVIQTMRELIQPCLDITERSLDQRIKEFQKVLYEFVFFKYLSQRKVHLALGMIDKLIQLNPNENCIIYDVFLIDVIVEQFNDTTSDLIIKLISYYYDQAKQLRDLLSELLSVKLTTTELEEFIQGKIDKKIQSGKYRFFDVENYIFAYQVREFALDNMKPNDKQNLCHFLDTVYKHLEKSAEFVAKKRYYQIIYRIMLFNPYLAAQFIYSKHKNTNLKALRGFFSFMSQQFVFNPNIILKVGAYIFIIMLQRMKDNFLISQQIKEYEKLDLNYETIDEVEFEKKFSDIHKLNPMEKLVYESYLAMKAKSQAYIDMEIYLKIQDELNKAKNHYDKDLFLIKKNNLENLQKYQQISYLSYNEWITQPKLTYYLHNINQYNSYPRFSYCYDLCDKDDQYVMKGLNQFEYPRIQAWPDKVQFDKIKERREIMVQGKVTRIPDGPGRCPMLQSQSVSDKTNLLEPQSKRNRKASSYLPEQFEIHRKQTSPNHKTSGSFSNMQRMPSKTSFKEDEQVSKQLKRTFSNEFIPVEQENTEVPKIRTQLLPPKPTQKKLNQSQGSGKLIQTQVAQPAPNPILDFLSGSMFRKP